MTPQELKNSILQMAIQGKLVEQRPEEGTAEKLYQQIQDEKQELIKAGTIKKEKPLPEITEDEKPFDVPDSWIWVRLDEISKLISDGTHKTPVYVERGVPFLSVKDISSGFLDFSQTKFIAHEEHKQLTQRCKPERNDVLICRIGTLGKAKKIDTDIEFSIFVSLGLIKPIMGEIAEYIEATVNSGYGFSWIQRVKVGGGTHTFKINLDDLRLMPIPLPPLAEQKRIVAKIEELLPYIERYEQAWSKLENFNKRIPGDMQKSILQMAIQGKLVEQRPEEGTGEELYQQIQAEKQRLIKAGTIRKEKPLPEITEDEKPFDIPESWKWVRLPSVASLCLGKMLDRQKNTGTPMPYLRNVNVRWGDFNLDDILKMKFDDVDAERFLIRKGDLVMCEGGEPGRCAVWKSNSSIHFQKALHRIRFFSDIDSMLYQFTFQYFSASGMLNTLFTGTTIKHLTGQVLEKILVPLPPLAEQKRIVAKLKEILPVCEKLK